jgi:putative spermidine/putrescine transport system ATP-binding protein
LANSTVVFNKLTKKYKDFYAVKDLSLELHEGEFFTLLGPSGSGKTTTLKMVAGLEIPTSGEIWVKGKEITFLPPDKRGLGMVFQNYALFPHMTIKENIAFPLKMQKKYSKDEITSRVKDILILMQLDGYQDRYPSQMSGGQQQRVALARALVFKPPIVLMDEPLGALDKKLRAAMQLEIKRIQQQVNITTIYVTHDQEEALTLSDRIAIMNAGEIVQLDSGKNIYEHPNSSFIADFIGESNFVPIDVVGHEGDDVILKIKSPSGSTFRYKGCDLAPPYRDDLKFVIRPEKIVVGRDLGAEAKLHCVISEVIYLGEMIKYIMTIDEMYQFVVKQQIKNLNIILEVGDHIDLAWEDECGNLLS